MPRCIRSGGSGSSVGGSPPQAIKDGRSSPRIPAGSMSVPSTPPASRRTVNGVLLPASAALAGSAAPALRQRCRECSTAGLLSSPPQQPRNPKRGSMAGRPASATGRVEVPMAVMSAGASSARSSGRSSPCEQGFPDTSPMGVHAPQPVRFAAPAPADTTVPAFTSLVNKGLSPLPPSTAKPDKPRPSPKASPKASPDAGHGTLDRNKLALFTVGETPSFSNVLVDDNPSSPPALLFVRRRPGQGKLATLPDTLPVAPRPASGSPQVFSKPQ